MDFIRTIEASKLEEEFDDDMYSDTCSWYFKNRPHDVNPGDLMFFAFHGRVRAVGRVTQIDHQRRADGYFWIKTRGHEYFTCDLPWRGYTGVKYLQGLAGQFGGKYAELAKRLQRIAKQYREQLNGT